MTKYFYTAVLFIFAFLITSSLPLQAQCQGCTYSVTLEGDNNSVIVVPKDNMTIFLTGTGTFKGTVNFNGKTGITFYVGRGVTISSDATFHQLNDVAIVNYGNWNKTLPEIQWNSLKQMTNYGSMTAKNTNIPDGEL